MLFTLLTGSAGASLMIFPVAFLFIYKVFFKERQPRALWIFAGYILTSIVGGFVLYTSAHLVGIQNVLTPNEESRVIINVALPLCVSAFVSAILCSRFEFKAESTVQNA